VELWPSITLRRQQKTTNDSEHQRTSTNDSVHSLSIAGVH
jgi:hypothetical protein